MSRGSVITIIVLIIIIAATVGLIVFFRGDGSFSFGREDITTPPVPPALPGSGDDTPQVPVGEKLTLTHRYAGGTHFFAGNMRVPTPCHTITQDVAIAESFPEQLRIAFTINEPAPDVICTQVVSRKEFSFEVPGVSAGATVTAVTVNGAAVSFEIFEESKG